MAKSLAQIQAQIERLTAEAAVIRKREAAAVIERIKEAISHYGLTAEDLGLVSGPKRNVGARKVSAKPVSKPRQAAKSATKGQPKFSDGKGNQWTGMGPKPKWFKTALAAGKTVEDLQIK